MNAPSLAFVVPCYNEEEVLEALLGRLHPISQALVDAGAIGGPARIVLVDDGSSDRTWEMIEAASQDSAGQVQGIKLSRNHGHQAALLAGLMTAQEDVLISLDADLQDDPDAIPKMVEAHGRGADIVFGVRSRRDTDTAFKRWSAQSYYSVLQGMGIDIIPDHADYRLMSRRAVEALRGFDEANLFLRGIIKSLGFQTEVVTYARSERFAGESKYPVSKMLKLAVEGITSFSTRPLRYVTFMGIGVALIAMMLALYSLVQWSEGTTVSGWTSIMMVILFLGAFQLIALGIIGEYLGKVFIESKKRPRFLIDKIVGGDGAEAPGSEALGRTRAS